MSAGKRLLRRQEVQERLGGISNIDAEVDVWISSRERA